METLSVTNEQEAPKGTKFSGKNPFVLVSKAWNKNEGWMKSTKVCNMDHGCLVQVSTQQNNNVAESLEFIPGANYSFEKKDFEVL